MNSARKKIRILLVDDHTILRDGLKSLFVSHSDLEVVGEAQNGVEAVALTQRLSPEVVVMDISMRGGSGPWACRELKRQFPSVRVLALTVHEDASYLNEMLSAGASGYILKRVAADELVKAVLTVASGGAYIDPAMSAAVLESLGPRSSVPPVNTLGLLTLRETDVIRLLARGFTQKEIAAKLAISTKTVETHKAKSLEKLGLHSRADLVRFAFQQGWLDDLRKSSTS